MIAWRSGCLFFDDRIKGFEVVSYVHVSICFCFCFFFRYVRSDDEHAGAIVAKRALFAVMPLLQTPAYLSSRLLNWSFCLVGIYCASWCCIC